MFQLKSLHKITLMVYMIFLLWLVLFKLSSDPISVLVSFQSRTLNLIPFAGYSLESLREMIDNLVVFVPLGLLLSINSKHIGFWQKLIYISVFSATAEILQFVFAIGITDVTDVITNTLGGLLGLGAYSIVSRYIENKKLDHFITIIIAILLIVFVYLRFMVFRVQY